MKNMMFARVVALTFLWLAIQILPSANSVVSGAQRQSIASGLEGTEWKANQSGELYSSMIDEHLIGEFVCSFGKQGKVTCEVIVTASGRLKSESYRNPATGGLDYRLEHVPSRTLNNLSGSKIGTYEQNGNSIQIEISIYKIEATIQGNRMHGEISLEHEPNQKARWVAGRISGGSNSSVDNSGGESTQSRTKPATEDSSVGGLKLGTYKGTAIAPSDGTRGTIRIIIQNIDGDGNVKATLRFSDNLLGEGSATGTIDDSGNLRLRGVLVTTLYQVLEWDFILTAKVEGNSLINGQCPHRERQSRVQSQAVFDLATLESRSNSSKSTESKVVRVVRPPERPGWQALEKHRKEADRLMEQKKYVKAIENYTMAISLAPDIAKLYWDRGYAKLELKDYEGAIEDFNEVIRLDAAWKAEKKAKNIRGVSDVDVEFASIDFSNIYTNRGFAKGRLGDKVGACQDFRKACNMGAHIACENSKKVCK